jgi:ergothioneine biosynthesis protein EgtB
MLTSPAPSPTVNRDDLLAKFNAIRQHSLALAEPLSAEDQCVQSMPDASPTKWHLAHTTWFFETLVLAAHEPKHKSFNEHYNYLFNSYYESLGPRHSRLQRGLLTRPSQNDILAYRKTIDAAMREFISTAPTEQLTAAQSTITLGLHHEQQHQELLLTDALHLLSLNPLKPAYLHKNATPDPAKPIEHQWQKFSGGKVSIGHHTPGFSFDNETPKHDVLLQPYQLANRPINCAEYLEFVQSGGYQNPDWWLSEGWAQVQTQQWTSPLYWDLTIPSNPQHFTQWGMQPLDPHSPVCHLSLFEASAYSAWAKARLPTEFEWEAAALTSAQHTGQVWEWTRSSYDPYPGFKPLRGAAREYNGKFMVGQNVLRGSSSATPPGHSRSTYRNFFPPATRWQFAGLRLARDL